MSDNIVCPHCGSNGWDAVGEIPQLNVEAYGNKNFRMACSKCDKGIYVSLSRVVKLNYIKPYQGKERDF